MRLSRCSRRRSGESASLSVYPATSLLRCGRRRAVTDDLARIWLSRRRASTPEGPRDRSDRRLSRSSMSGSCPSTVRYWQLGIAIRQQKFGPTAFRIRGITAGCAPHKPARSSWKRARKRSEMKASVLDGGQACRGTAEAMTTTSGASRSSPWGNLLQSKRFDLKADRKPNASHSATSAV